MNAITTPASTAVAALQSLKQGLQNVSSTIISAGGDPFLRLLKDGNWVYGAENVDVQEGSYWAVNPLSLEHGFVAWTDHPGKQVNEIVGEVMVPMTQPLPPRASLADVGWPWSQQLSWQVRCMTGEDEGTQVLYKTTSVGGIRAMEKLIAAISAQLDRDPGKPVPVIELLTDSYQHKKWGQTYTPVFDIKRWIALDDASGGATETEHAAAPAAAPEPEKATRRRRASSAPEVKQEQAQPAQAQEQPAQAQAEDPVAARRRELEAQLAALNADTGYHDATTPPPFNVPDAAPGGNAAYGVPNEATPGQPIRRRRV